MPAIEPIHCTPRPYHRKNPRWYHSHIIEWMLAHPSGSLAECAAYVGKQQQTISAIIRSDMFQAALAKRKAELAAQNDLVLSKKLTEVATASLDAILDVIEKKKHTLPLDQLDSIANNTLQRLGYGLPQKGQTNAAVQVNVNGPSTMQPAVTAAELEQARELVRQNQQRIASNAPPPAPPPEVIVEGSATFIPPPQKEAVLVEAEEVVSASDISQL